MIEREHRVGLAATEVGLQFNHRVSSFTRETLDPIKKQSTETFREAFVEILWPSVFVRRIAAMNHCEVSGKLRLCEIPCSHVGMRMDDFAPWSQSFTRRAAGLALRAARPCAAFLQIECA